MKPSKLLLSEGPLEIALDRMPFGKGNKNIKEAFKALAVRGTTGDCS